MRSVIRAGQSSGDDIRFMLAGTAVQAFEAAADALRGSPLAALAQRRVGADVHPRAVLMAWLPEEKHLQRIDEGAVVDWDAKVVSLAADTAPAGQLVSRTFD